MEHVLMILFSRFEAQQQYEKRSTHKQYPYAETNHSLGDR
jgi:hypothetical protein